jgi:uracil-DNA glycosylase
MGQLIFPKFPIPWGAYLDSESSKPYFKKLLEFLHQEHSQESTLYPKTSEYFQSLNLVSPEQAKVVIIGQDPYHGQAQAHGLSFSVKSGVPPPPSLQNIFKEISRCFGTPPPKHGNLTHWCEQGVLLLNSVLTVRAGEPGSHRNQGWEILTDAVIATLTNYKPNLVFMLWGKDAQKKGTFIDRDLHLVLQASHPSPLSAYRGFLGCDHFLKANQYLKQHGKTPVHWHSV